MGQRLRHWTAVLLLAIASAGMSFVSSGAEGAPSDQAGFTADVAEQITKAAGGDISITVEGPLFLSVRGQNGEISDSLHLNRIWDYCTQNPSTCDQAVSEYVTGTLEGIKTRSGPIDRVAVRVVVRTTAYLAAARTDGGQGDRDPAAAPLAGDLWIICVADSPHSTRILTNADLRLLKLSINDAIELGKRNVSAALPPLSSTQTKFGDGTFETVIGDPYYESSRIILHDEWLSIAMKMRGQLVVAVPGSGIVIYGNGASKRTVEAMRKFAHYAAGRSDRPISGTLLRWTEEGWEPVSP